MKFSSAKFAAEKFLTELAALINSTPKRSKYVEQNRSDLANTEVEFSHELEISYEYIFEKAIMNCCQLKWNGLSTST